MDESSIGMDVVVRAIDVVFMVVVLVDSISAVDVVIIVVVVVVGAIVVVVSVVAVVEGAIVVVVFIIFEEVVLFVVVVAAKAPFKAKITAIHCNMIFVFMLSEVQCDQMGWQRRTRGA